MNDSRTLYLKQKIGLIIVVIELILVVASLIFGLRYGMEQVTQSLQLLIVLISLTIFSLIIDGLMKDYEDRKNEQHHGTYHEIKT